MCTSLRPAVSLTTQCACSGVRHRQARHQPNQWHLLPSLWRSPRLRLQRAATTQQMWACCCSPFWLGWRAFLGVSLLETAPRPQEALQDSLDEPPQYQPYGQHEALVDPGYLGDGVTTPAQVEKICCGLMHAGKIKAAKRQSCSSRSSSPTCKIG